LKKLVILQTVVPYYRKDIFTFLKEELKYNFNLYGGNSYFEKSITTDKNITFINPISNYYFFNRKLLFQFGMWGEVFRDNVMVLEMNPRIITNWFILIIMRKLGSEIIVYTKTQAKELKLKMPNKKVIAAPNALYFKEDMGASLNGEKINNIIYVGRLSKPKKAFFLVKTFHKFLDKIPSYTKLIIVGEGEEKSLIENYIIKYKISDRILVKGHISNIEKLKKLYVNDLMNAHIKKIVI